MYIMAVPMLLNPRFELPYNAILQILRPKIANPRIKIIAYTTLQLFSMLRRKLRICTKLLSIVMISVSITTSDKVMQN